MINDPRDPARRGNDLDLTVHDSEDGEEPDFIDQTLELLPNQPKAVLPIQIDPGDEVLIVNLNGIDTTQFDGEITINQKVTVVRKGLKCCYVQFDGGMRVWFGYNRLALNGFGAEVLQALAATAKPVEPDEVRKPNLAHGCEPLPPRMKDAEVVAHTAEERFIRIQLDNPREVPPGIIVTPESAFSDSTERAYTALRISGIVPYSLIHIWNNKYPHNALAIGDLIREVGGKAIAQLTASKTNKFEDIEKMNVEQHLCSPTLDAVFGQKQ